MKTLTKKKNTKIINLKKTSNKVKVVKKNKKVDLDELISLTDASKLCNYSQEYLSLMSRKGKIDAVKSGRNWKISRRVLFAYIEAHKADFAGNNRGRFSKKAVEVVKIYKRDKIVSKIISPEVIIRSRQFTFPKFTSYISAPVVTLVVLLLITFAPHSSTVLGSSFKVINNLFQVTVVRGAELSYMSLVEAKNVAVEMRRFISGESRQENLMAAKFIWTSLKNERKNFRNVLSDSRISFNTFISEQVVAPKLEFLSNSLKFSKIKNISFNILQWDLNSYSKTITSIKAVNPSVKNSIVAIFSNDQQTDGVQARVAGVQEVVNKEISPSKVDKNIFSDFLGKVKSFLDFSR